MYFPGHPPFLAESVPDLADKILNKDVPPFTRFPESPQLSSQKEPSWQVSLLEKRSEQFHDWLMRQSFGSLVVPWNFNAASNWNVLDYCSVICAQRETIIWGIISLTSSHLTFFKEMQQSIRLVRLGWHGLVTHPFWGGALQHLAKDLEITSEEIQTLT